MADIVLKVQHLLLRSFVRFFSSCTWRIAHFSRKFQTFCSLWSFYQGTAGKAGPRGQRGPTVGWFFSSFNKPQQINTCHVRCRRSSFNCLPFLRRVLVADVEPEVRQGNQVLRYNVRHSHSRQTNKQINIKRFWVLCCRAQQATTDPQDHLERE